MICPDCKNKTHVINSRSLYGGKARRRRYVCKECGKRFNTWEFYNDIKEMPQHIVLKAKKVALSIATGEKV